MQGNQEYCVKALNGLGDHLTRAEYNTMQSFAPSALPLLDPHGQSAVRALQLIYSR